MIVGYARTSTLEQEAGFEAQLRDLKAAGCERTYQEQRSSVAHRPQLEAALDFVREGDTFMVTKVDRLARSMPHLMTIVEGLKAKKVRLVVKDLGIDTGTPTGSLILGVLGSIAQWERTMMLERQAIGISKAKAEGKYKGRKPTARARGQPIRHLLAQGRAAEAVFRPQRVLAQCRGGCSPVPRRHGRGWCRR